MRAIFIGDEGERGKDAGAGAPRRISLRDLPDPQPGPGEALVAVLVAGICRTDVELSRGYMGFSGVAGHEFVGRVIGASSRADGQLVGARVTGEINIGCDDCPACAAGMARHCPRREVLGILGRPGAFAEKLTLPVANLHAVPANLTDEQAVFIEPTAAAFEILDQISVSPSERVLVLGDGKLGLLIGQTLATRGCRVVVEGRHEANLALARRLGLETAASGGAEAASYDLVIEATGRPSGLDLALARVRPRGRVVLKTTCATETKLDLSRAVVNEVTLIGSRCGRFQPAIEALSTGAVKVDDLVAGRFSLEEGADAFRRAAEPGTLKVLLRVAD